MHSLGRLRAVRAQGGAASCLSRRASLGFIRHFPSRAARASTSSPGGGASLPPPADPPRAPPRAVLAERSTRGAASPVCRLLREAGGPLLGRLSFLLLPILGILQPGVEHSARPAQGWDRQVAGIWSPWAAPHGAATRDNTARQLGQWPWCWFPRRPRSARPVRGLDPDSGRPAPCPLGYRRLRPESSSAFRSCLSLAEARDAARQINEKARQCSSQRRSPQEVY